MFKDLRDKAAGIASGASEVSAKYLDEFNEALPTLKALGFSVRDFSVGMGVIPEVSATLVAKIEDVNVSKLNGLAEQYKERKTLVFLLKALQAAYNIRNQVPDIPFTGVQLDMKLGLPPHAGVKFLGAASVEGAGRPAFT
jgi:hypothetical protein